MKRIRCLPNGRIQRYKFVDFLITLNKKVWLKKRNINITVSMSIILKVVYE